MIKSFQKTQKLFILSIQVIVEHEGEGVLRDDVSTVEEAYDPLPIHPEGKDPRPCPREGGRERERDECEDILEEIASEENE